MHTLAILISPFVLFAWLLWQWATNSRDWQTVRRWY